jgi:hypothetical protein
MPNTRKKQTVAARERTDRKELLPRMNTDGHGFGGFGVPPSGGGGETISAFRALRGFFVAHFFFFDPAPPMNLTRRAMYKSLLQVKQRFVIILKIRHL